MSEIQLKNAVVQHLDIKIKTNTQQKGTESSIFFIQKEKVRLKPVAAVNATKNVCSTVLYPLMEERKVWVWL